MQIVEGKATTDDIQASSEPETAPDPQTPEFKAQPVTTPVLAEIKKGDTQDWLQPEDKAADAIPDDHDKYRAPF